MNGLLFGLIASLLPFFELRLGLPLLVYNGMPVLVAFLVSVAVNLLVIPIVYFFLDYLHKHLSKFRYYEKAFRYYEDKYKRKVEKKIGTKWEYWVLFVIVAVPLPGTGAYSGTLIAWLFGLDRKKSYLAISLGVVVAGILVALATASVIRLI